MKKLKLNFEQFSEAETLSRSHMKSVLGGGTFGNEGVTTTVPGAPCQWDGDCPQGQKCLKAGQYSKMGVCFGEKL